MILQALNDYYQRKTVEPGSGLAELGFEQKELPFIIEVNSQGELIQIEDTRTGDGKKKISQSFIVPQGTKKTSGVATNLLWDNAEYVLGIDKNCQTLDDSETEQQRQNEVEKRKGRVADQHQAFIDKIKSLPEPAISDEGVQAVINFLDQLVTESLESLPFWNEVITNPTLSFRLQGDRSLVCQRLAVINALRAYVDEPPDEAHQTTCLITGESMQAERLHTSIKGVWGAQSSGANIVSFNLDAFNSYGKNQGYNAPVGKKATFAYTTALNYLLRKNSPQRMQVGDTSTVFWSEKPTTFETAIADIFGEPSKDDPDKNTRAVASLYGSMHNGLLSSDEGQTRFYVLGLAPNAARIAIRFWQVATVAELAMRIRQHFDDLAIVHGDKQLPHLPLFRLLVATATQGKADNIPPNIAGETMRSILSGQPYPHSLLGAAVRRNRAEQEVSYARAALIKACINRLTRYKNPDITEELKVSLDETNNNIGYRLGRLFAVLEKVQEEASPGINATIRDRYYGAASSTPVSVFATLLKLKNHHISKLDNKGRATNLEKLIGQIVEAVTDFPPNLSMQEQGRFAIGYYHQRQDFFKKKPELNTKTNTSPTNGESS
ncbi:MAG: type I-C CRISPR-associated protein Cas8c/Csd1 [Gammaproteobacteria bacterium]|nr:type I-C CRISPR-associated protein Cas8c/Csd1 [Gammaproteobacteria bacterium]MBQ0839971.1 type I-C CRISPR-associated protein Cas8c/Csd1 [Gammaproteobacteria bacterium]